jgi:hypothetical protein
MVAVAAMPRAAHGGYECVITLLAVFARPLPAQIATRKCIRGTSGTYVVAAGAQAMESANGS